MSYQILFVLNALVAVVLGAAFLVVPDRALGFFAVDPYESTLLMARFFGSALLAFGLVLWFVKDVEASIHKRIGWAVFISAILGLVLNVLGLSSGIIRANGWITAVVYVVFALLYAFMIFIKPKMRE